MGVFKDLLGTLQTSFQHGIGGVRTKSDSGVLQARNAADNAFAAMAAALFQTYGDDFELNSGATGSGDSWKMTIRRPSTGMTHDLIFVFPDEDPAPNQALTVASLVGDVITLQWTTIAAGTDKVVVDTTTLVFGSSTPLAMFTLPANGVVLRVEAIIDTPFNGTAPSASVGIAGTTSKYMGAGQVNLKADAGTVFEVTPAVAANGATENLIITYAPDSSSAGSARFLVYYAIPS